MCELQFGTGGRGTLNEQYPSTIKLLRTLRPQTSGELYQTRWLVLPIRDFRFAVLCTNKLVNFSSALLLVTVLSTLELEKHEHVFNIIRV